MTSQPKIAPPLALDRIQSSIATQPTPTTSPRLCQHQQRRFLKHLVEAFPQKYRAVSAPPVGCGEQSSFESRCRGSATSPPLTRNRTQFIPFCTNSCESVIERVCFSFVIIGRATCVCWILFLRILLPYHSPPHPIRLPLVVVTSLLCILSYLRWLQQEVGLSRPQSIRLVVRSPAIFAHSIDDNMAPKVRCMCLCESLSFLSLTSTSLTG